MGFGQSRPRETRAYYQLNPDHPMIKWLPGDSEDILAVATRVRLPWLFVEAYQGQHSNKQELNEILKYMTDSGMIRLWPGLMLHTETSE